jgi:DnaJ-class molecular chaperone
MNFNKAKELLELDDTFTPEQVKQNYHRLSLKFHPDKGGNTNDFVTITQAYEFMSNQQNEQSGQTEQSGPKINLNEIFRSFINPALHKVFTKVSDFPFFAKRKEIMLYISPREFLEGTKKEVEQTFKLHCGCQPVFCHRCRGFSVKTCEECNGFGVIQNCGECDNGFTNHSRVINVSIPPKSLKSIIVPEDRRYSSPEMIIHVELKKSKSKKNNYFVKQDKLYYRYPITLKESITGFEKTFKDPFDNICNVKSDTILQKNDGYTISNDLILLFDIIYPEKLSNQVIQQLKQINF